MAAITAEIRKAVKEFRENSYWRGLYDKAPAGAKKLLALQFWASTCKQTCGGVINSRLQELKRKLTVTDLQYLIENRGPGFAEAMAVKEYQKLLVSAHMNEKLKGISATYLLKTLKNAFKDWEANKIDDDGYNEIAHKCEILFGLLSMKGRVSERMKDKFLDEYTANMYAVNE